MEIFDDLHELAELLDQSGGEGYARIVQRERLAVVDSERTPSARIIAELADSRKSFFEFGLECARSHRDYFLSLDPVNDARMAEFAAEARASLAAQQAIEETDSISFDEYLERYFEDLKC